MALPPSFGQLSQKANAALGLPDGWKTVSALPFAGINQNAARHAISDQQAYYCENFVKVGDGELRSTLDAGPPFYTARAGTKIVWFSFYVLAGVYYAIVVLDDGTALQINTTNAHQTVISGVAGTFFQTGKALPDCALWGAQYLLISSNIQQNSYWAWDGSLLYTAGNISPVTTITAGGQGYTSPPTVTVYGGEGTGAAYTAVVSGGSVVALIPTAVGSGYVTTDFNVVQLAFSGGGGDTSAILQAVLSGAGSIAALNLGNGGTNYPNGTFPLTFTGGGGTGAIGTATISGGIVVSVSLTNGGTGYTSAPSVAPSVSNPFGTAASISASLGNGSIVAVDVIAPGSGYTSAPTVAFTGGGGSGAVGIAVITGQLVTGVIVTAGGTGYTSTPAVGFSGGGGSGASAVAVLTPAAVSSITIVDGGTGFSGTPTLTIQGGGGTGAQATATVTAGVISAVDVTNGGQGYTSSPAVIVQPGVNTAASATAELMPFGVNGFAITTFDGRVWLANSFTFTPSQPNSGVLTLSAPGSFTDFATSAGGLVAPSTDSTLQFQYTALPQSNGYLYPLGDSEVVVISNVQSSGTPTTTTFTDQNVDPQTGTIWRDTAQNYGRTIVFANSTGIWAVYGGACVRVSKDIDQLYEQLLLPNSGIQGGPLTLPCSSIATIYNEKYLLTLVSLADPTAPDGSRPVMLAWDQKDWFVLSQTPRLTFIAPQKTNAEFVTWGTDGATLFKLFQRASNQPKTWRSKAWGTQQDFIVKQPLGYYVRASNNSTELGSSVSISAAVEVDPNPNSTATTVVDPNGPLRFTNGAPMGQLQGSGFAGAGVVGISFGITLTSTSKQLSLYNVTLGYIDLAGIFGDA